MKKFSLTTVLVLITLGFSSCTQDDNTLLQEPSAEDLLKSYKIQRDASGAYSLDYDLSEGAEVENIKNEKNNTNNIYVYSSDSQGARSVENEDLTIQDGRVRIDFKDTNTGRTSFITIEDDKMSSRENDVEYLEGYSITENGDGTFDLDFTVKEGVEVYFTYNEVNDIHEVHLSEGETGDLNFKTTFTLEENETVYIDFVNHYSSNTGKAESELVSRKPRTGVGMAFE